LQKKKIKKEVQYPSTESKEKHRKEKNHNRKRKGGDFWGDTSNTMKNGGGVELRPITNLWGGGGVGGGKISRKDVGGFKIVRIQGRILQTGQKKSKGEGGMIRKKYLGERRHVFRN